MLQRALLVVLAVGLSACGGGGGGAEDTVTADEEAGQVDWMATAAEHRGRIGRRIAYDCQAGGSAGAVWGDRIYTDDSSVCTAAVHAGLITLEDGGHVVIEIAEGQEAYEGSTANGVTTAEYGPWDGSFTFPAA